MSLCLLANVHDAVGAFDQGARRAVAGRIIIPTIAANVPRATRVIGPHRVPRLRRNVGVLIIDGVVGHGVVALSYACKGRYVEACAVCRSTYTVCFSAGLADVSSCYTLAVHQRLTHAAAEGDLRDHAIRPGNWPRPPSSSMQRMVSCPPVSLRSSCRVARRAARIDLRQGKS